MSESIYTKEFYGVARIEKVVRGIARSLAEARINPQDLANPISFQIALSRLYEAILKSLSEGGKTTYVAEVRFNDSLGNPVVFAVDLGEKPPALSESRAKVKIVVEFIEE